MLATGLSARWEEGSTAAGQFAGMARTNQKPGGLDATGFSVLSTGPDV
jgi:hypothetical protein